MFATEINGTNEYYNFLKSLPTLTAEKNAELLQKYKNAENTESKRFFRDKIIEGNMGLVVKIVNSYINKCNFLTFQDLCQEGSFGLITAIERFDIALGNTFSTYAYNWINYYIRKALCRTESLIQKPTNLIKSNTMLRKIIEDAQNNNSPIPNCKELSKKIGQSEEITASLLETINILYGDAPIKEDDNFTFFDTLKNDSDIEDDICRKDQIERLLESINKIIKKDRSKKIFVYRTGLSDGVIHTLEETAKKYGVNKETVRKIENQTYQRLKDIYLNNVEYLKIYGYRVSYVNAVNHHKL